MPPPICLKPHHQAHRRDAATAPPPKTRATVLGSASEIEDQRSVRSDQSLRCRLRERESSVYATPIELELAMPQGILHFTSLFSLLIFEFCCGLWSETEGERALFLFELILS